MSLRRTLSQSREVRAFRQGIARLTHQWPRPRHLPTVPICPDGFFVGPPDFVGVGSQKAGTSWWFSLIAAHPGVHEVPGVPKELHFFEGFWEREFREEDIERYHRYFPRQPGSIAGEWTTLYMHDPWVMPLLGLAAPQARILVLVRDPVERYISGIAHDLARGAPESAMLAAAHFSRGCYANQFERLLKAFGRTQMLVLQYERCVERSRVELAKTFEFLGLEDSGYIPAGLHSEVNKTTSKPRLDPAVRQRLIEAYEEDVEDLTRSFAEIDVGLWPNFAHLA